MSNYNKSIKSKYKKSFIEVEKSNGFSYVHSSGDIYFTGYEEPIKVT